MSDLRDLYENKYDTSIEEASNKFEEIQEKMKKQKKDQQYEALRKFLSTRPDDDSDDETEKHPAINLKRGGKSRRRKNKKTKKSKKRTRRFRKYH